MIAFLRLLRFQNLLIIALTQYIMRFCIIEPFLRVNHFKLQLSEVSFLLLVLATMLIAAGGYVINDYFDTKTDLLNKPDRVVLDRQVPRRYAILIHLVLSLAGILTGVYLSFHIGVPALSFLFILGSGLLWFYSTNYKRQFLVGNLVISMITAGVPMLVILYEMPLLNDAYGSVMLKNNTSFNYILYWISGFSFFAFITTLLREIIKDAEDFEGDNAYGMNTLPIVLGTTHTKYVIAAISALVLIILAWLLARFIMFNEFVDYISGAYFTAFLFIPLCILIVMIIKARSKEDYHRASNLTKFIMVAGIFYAFIVRLMVLQIYKDINA